MASRQAGFFVRHTEKIVLALAVVFSLLLVAIAWGGIFGTPSSTEVGRDTVTPGTVESVVKAEATRLRQALDAPEPGVPDVTIPPYSDEFAQRIARPLLPSENQNLGASIAETFAAVNLVPRKTDFPTYHLPDPPVIADAVLKVGKAVLAEPGSVADPRERERVVTLARSLDLQPGQPGDLQYVSVMGRYPLQTWVERLRSPDPDRENQPIPENVWGPRMGLAAVYLLRQKEDPRTGAWGATETVPTLPGQVAFLPGRPTDADTPGRAEEIVSFIGQQQDDVTRVPFPATVHTPWTPPSGRDRVFSTAEAARLAELEKQIDAAESRIARLEGRDEQESARPGRPTRGVDEELGGYDGGYGEQGGAGGGRNRGRETRRPTRGGGGDEDTSADERRIQTARDELQAMRTELAEMLGEDAPAVAGGGYGEGGYGGGGYGDGGYEGGYEGGPGRPGYGGGFNPGRGGAAAPGPAADVAEAVLVWAHALSVEPGATYRYKLVAAPINPLFRYSRVSEEQRVANRDRLALAPAEEELEAIGWTPAVTLNPRADFFFLGGNAEQDRARLEVWKVYDGLWQTAEFEENAGNGIGGVEMLEVRGRRQQVDLGTSALLLDIDVQQALDASPDQRVIYETPEGSIGSRTRQADQDSDRRKQLQRELKEQQSPDAA